MRRAGILILFSVALAAAGCSKKPAPAAAPPAKAVEILPVLHVPPGFRVENGTMGEPYTRTGWAREIVHEKTGMAMVFIPAGEFTMGSPGDERDRVPLEGPHHKVRLTKPFYLGKYLVTQGEWEKVAPTNPSRNQGDARLPVEQVSYADCLDFCAKAGDGLRLPTEAEWERACRAGTTTRYFFGDDQVGLLPYAWYYENSDGKTHPVGLKEPNPWGLCDICGNAWEWTADYFGRYDWEAAVDPKGPSAGEQRVIRGGSILMLPMFCRSAYRAAVGLDYRFYDLGFRAALDAN